MTRQEVSFFALRKINSATESGELDSKTRLEPSRSFAVDEGIRRPPLS
jgi:hypothetical protein